MKIIAFFLLLTLGIGMFFRGWLIYKKTMRLDKWLKVTVWISSAEVGTIQESAVNVFLDFYYPKVNYSYELNGRRYESDSVSPDFKGCCFSSQKDAEELLLYIKSDHTAYVNPDNLSESFLTKFVSLERKAHYRGLLVSGSLVTVIGIMIFIMAAI